MQIKKLSSYLEEIMNRKVKLTTIVTLLVAFVAGCSQTPPKCSDESTFTLIRKIIIDQIGGSEGFTDNELKDNMKIEFPRASSLDEKIKKYSCEAKLIAGGSIELPITYESQLDDKNQHIVSVGGISNMDLAYMKDAITQALIKSRGIKDTPAPPATEPIPQEQSAPEPTHPQTSEPEVTTDDTNGQDDPVVEACVQAIREKHREAIGPDEIITAGEMSEWEEKCIAEKQTK